MAETPATEQSAEPAGATSARPTPLGIYDKPKPQAVTGIEIVAINRATDAQCVECRNEPCTKVWHT